MGASTGESTTTSTGASCTVLSVATSLVGASIVIASFPASFVTGESAAESVPPSSSGTSLAAQ
jgi:hypothetical protein